MESHHSGKSSYVWGTILILLGTLLLLDRMYVIDFRDLVRDYWPLILVLIGAKMILFPSQRGESAGKHDQIVSPAVPPTTGAGTRTGYLSENRFIGDVDVKVENDDFQGGAASTFIGDLRLDLSGTSVKAGDRHLSISSFIGDTLLKLPANTAYSIQVNTMIGDLNTLGMKQEGFGINKFHKSPDYDNAAARLNVRVTSFIGDVTIV